MATLLSPDYVLEQVTEDDLAIASIAWGFTLGFGWLTTWTAIKQTAKSWKRSGSRSIQKTYIWLIWLEIIIIINRCAILMTERDNVRWLKYGVAVLMIAVNISVYAIWIPARLQISEQYILINGWWDRCEKVIYILVDGALNVYYILIVKRNLVSHGLIKYKRLATFNIFIIFFSLSMDVLIISMMSLDNTFVYMQFHPLAYLVKLNIEMSLADLIAKVARKKEPLPSIRTPMQGESRGVALGAAPLRDQRSSAGRDHQPPPPVKTAVPLKAWATLGLEELKHNGLDPDMGESLPPSRESVVVVTISARKPNTDASDYPAAHGSATVSTGHGPRLGGLPCGYLSLR